MSKQPFKLTDDELNKLSISINERQPEVSKALWEAVCKRLNVSLDSLEDARTGDPHDFLAEPLATVPAVIVNDPIRQGWTSASNAQADSLCPGRHIAQRGIPETPRGEDALMGTRIHDALATDGKALQSLSLEEREIFDSCRTVEQKVIASYLGADAKYRAARHERLWVKFPRIQNTGNLGQTVTDIQHSGEPDAVLRAGTKALIMDYKVLAGDVAESPKNMQLRDLAVLVKVNTPLLWEIAVVIIQPLVTHSPELCTYSPDDLNRAATDLRLRVEASNNAASPRVAGEVQCKFCKAKATCKEFAQWQGTAMVAIAGYDGDAELFKLSMDKWSPEQWGAALSLKQRVEKFCDLLRDSAKDRLSDNPSAIPGWGLKPGAVRETIVNPQECFNRFAAEGGKLEEFFPCIKVEKGKFKEAVAEVTKLKGVKLKGKLGELLEGLTESKQSAPSLERSGE